MFERYKLSGAHDNVLFLQVIFVALNDEAQIANSGGDCDAAPLSGAF